MQNGKDVISVFSKSFRALEDLYVCETLVILWGMFYNNNNC